MQAFTPRPTVHYQVPAAATDAHLLVRRSTDARTVQQLALDAATTQQELNLRGYEPGVYFATLLVGRTAVQLRVPGLRAQGPIGGQLLDGLGRELRRFTLQPQGGTAETTLRMDDLPAGVYTLRLLPVEGSIVKRLVKQ